MDRKELTPDEIEAFKAAHEAAGSKYDEMLLKCRTAHVKSLEEMGRKMVEPWVIGGDSEREETWDLSEVTPENLAQKMYGEDAIALYLQKKIVDGKDMIYLITGGESNIVVVAFEEEGVRIPRQVTVEVGEEVAYNDVINFLRQEDAKKADLAGGEK